MNPLWSLPVPPLIHTCLWFDTEAEAAAEFYASVFPRSQVTAITRYGPAMPMPEGLALTVELVKGPGSAAKQRMMPVYAGASGCLPTLRIPEETSRETPAV